MKIRPLPQVFVAVVLFFETGFLCVALESRLALNSQRSAYLYLPSAGFKGLCHHDPTTTTLFELHLKQASLNTGQVHPWDPQGMVPNYFSQGLTKAKST